MHLFRTQINPAVILAMLILLTVPGSAHAYIDPGSGSLIWQILIASLLSALVLIKTYWRRIRKLITGKEPAAIEDEDREE